MTLPTPASGLVIRYAYLWKSEAVAGRQEGGKNRPCAIILTADVGRNRIRVIVLPITHAPPITAEDGVKLPQATKSRLGLDEERSWIVLSEGNDFVWPGPDLRPLSGQGLQSAALGFLPPRLFTIIRNRFVARLSNKRASLTLRSD